MEILKPQGIYFDNAATSLMPRDVLNIINKYYSIKRSNVGRGMHDLGREVTQKVEEVRGKIQEYFHAYDFYVVFTFNSTFASNILAMSYAGPLNSLLISVEEHNSSYLPWFRRAKKENAIIDFLKINEGWNLDYESLDGRSYDVAVITAASNVIGKINNINKVANFIVVDGAQLAGHRSIDLDHSNIDAFYFSSHKCLGPYGAGALLIRKEKAEFITPSYLGGGAVISATYQDYTLKPLPHGFEPGTPCIAEIMGLGKALEIIKENEKMIENKEKELVKEMHEVFEELGIDYQGNTKDKNKLPLFSFNVNGMHYNALALYLNENNIYVRAGHHCAHLLMDYLGIKGSVRASLHFYNTSEEIQTFKNVLKKVIK